MIASVPFCKSEISSFLEGPPSANVQLKPIVVEMV